MPDFSAIGNDTDAGEGGPGRRERHREARRAELVDAAIRAIRGAGAAVSVADIAAAAGITKPVLYRHFADRADLQKAVGERVAATLLVTVSDTLGQDRAPVEQTKAVIDVVLVSVEEDPELWRFVTHRAAHSVGDQLVDNLRERIARLLATQLGDELRRRGHDSGGAEVWAHGLVGMVHGAAEWWLAHRSMSRADLVDSLAALAWSGIADVFLSAAGTHASATAAAPSRRRAE